MKSIVFRFCRIKSILSYFVNMGFDSNAAFVYSLACVDFDTKQTFIFHYVLENAARMYQNACYKTPVKSCPLFLTQIDIFESWSLMSLILLWVFYQGKYSVILPIIQSIYD